MTIYDLLPQPNGVVLAGDASRFFYAESGAFSIRSMDGEAIVSTDDGRFSTGGEIRIEGEGRLWIFEVKPADRPLAGREAVTPVLSRVLRLGFAAPWVMRADRVESSPGSVMPRHGHRGPGMRRLVYGRILAEIGDEIDCIDAGRAWFETGRDWVVGTNISNSNSVFVRVMILPMELQGGKSSFVPASPEEGAKPRAVTYRLFGEQILD